MHSLKIKIEIQAELSKDGKIIKRYPWKKANSLLKGFIQALAAQMSDISQTITDTGNIGRASAKSLYNLTCNAGAGATTFGLLIGTNSTPVIMTDYKLGTPVTTNIAHGNVTFAVENPDANTWRLAIARTFTNNTGSALGVEEAALYTYFSASQYIICIDRTLYQVSVGAGVTLTLTYRITATL